MKNILEFDLGLVSKYRGELMGVATIGILMCHALHYDVNLPFHLNSFLGVGQMGVSMFFFLSGIGLYYSTRKLEPTAKSVGTWYKKRFVRLLIPYLIIYGSVLFISVGNEENGFSFAKYLYRLSTLSYWFGDGGAWFVDVLIPIYLLTPLWNAFLEKIKYPIIPTILIMGVMMFVDNPFNGAFMQASFFFLGFWLARYVKSEKKLSTKYVIWFILGIAALMALYYLVGVGFLLAILVLPTIWIVCVFANWWKLNCLNSVLRFFGSISLESYLINTTLITWIDHFHLLPDTLYPYRYVFIVVFGVALAWLVNRLSQPIVDKLNRG